MSDITLDSLIEEGNNILKGISYITPPRGVLRFYAEYGIKDAGEYTTWKHRTIRFISSKYPQDSYIPELIKQFDEFEKHHCSPSVFNQILGLIKAYKEIPEPIVLKPEGQKPLVEVNNIQSQQQSQTFQLIVDIINDELTGRQQKELKDIIASKADAETKRKSIFDKIKSFGTDVASNIVANILTNPSIYGSFFNI